MGIRHELAIEGFGEEDSRDSCKSVPAVRNGAEGTGHEHQWSTKEVEQRQASEYDGGVEVVPCQCVDDEGED